MPKIQIDFSNVENYDPLPPGDYPVIVDSIELRQSESSEHPYLNFTLKVTEGEFEGRNLWFIGSLSPKALFRLKPVFESFGFTDDQAEIDVDDASGVLLEPQLIGLPAIARTTNEMYQGSLRTRVNELVGTEGDLTEAAAPAAAAAPAGRRSPFAPKAAAAPARKFS